MKGLRKYLTPFAPDQSGAVSVLYGLGGILIICDAGGCVGNICGFDEPRWQEKRSAIFSAGLRDMDAIMGRDELLVKKLKMAAEQIEASFVALIGTPVPAVIATDYHALTRMAERKTGLPVLAVDTNGMDLYDKGASKAYMELFSRFAGDMPQRDENGENVSRENSEEKKGLGLLGCDPLDGSDLHAPEKLKAYFEARGETELYIYGMEGGLSAIKKAPLVKKNVVLSPSGLAAARYLEKKYGTSYQCMDPLAELFIREQLQKDPELKKAKKILIIDQQIAANTMREQLQTEENEITVAGFFMMDKELKKPGDIRLTEEDQCRRLLKEGAFDLVIADPVIRRMDKDFRGIFLEKTQFSISGKMTYD